MISFDTSLEAARVHCEILRELGPERRAAMAMEMSDNLRNVVAAGIRARHPDYSDDQVQLAVCKLTWGDRLFRQVYPGQDVEV